MEPSSIIVISLVVAYIATEILLHTIIVLGDRRTRRPKSRFGSRSAAGTRDSEANSDPCRTYDSHRPDCGGNPRINILKDGHNYGRGHKCNHPQACSGEECVDIHNDRKHSGKSNKKCKKGALASTDEINLVGYTPKLIGLTVSMI
ncbi:hypothetical protein EJ110_NYTH55235 [Nymphaea thermarum]|nr:hypothetical protein EJ110_NYTH55235 [Nymphaea thermarum]